MHTMDGKQYVTVEQLEQEIQDEVLVHGGRINITDLQAIVNVDLSYIDSAIENILKFDSSFFHVHGEVLSATYLNTMCDEIDELLRVFMHRLYTCSSVYHAACVYCPLLTYLTLML